MGVNSARATNGGAVLGCDRAPRMAPLTGGAGPMSDVILYGYDASVYVRIVQLTLAEKGVAHDYVRVASFDGSEKYPQNEGLHPFRRVPVFEHMGLRLHETRAVAEYIDEVFGGPALMPGDPMLRAMVRQTISVYDNYCHAPWVHTIVSERLFPDPVRGPDEMRIDGAAGEARHAARVIDALLGSRGQGALTLADLHIAPGLHYLLATPEGRTATEGCTALLDWWAALRERPAVERLLTLPDPA